MGKKNVGHIPHVEPQAKVPVAGVCEMFDESLFWVYERIADGDFQSIKEDGKRLVTGASIAAYVEKQRSAQSRPRLHPKP